MSGRPRRRTPRAGRAGIAVAALLLAVAARCAQAQAVERIGETRRWAEGERPRPAPALLGGADALLEGGAPQAALLPARLEAGSWAGPALWTSLRNDRLSLNVWNDHVGHRLEEPEKRELLDQLGHELRGRLDLRSTHWALALRVPGTGVVAGLALESTGGARAAVDGSLVEAALLGNDPARPLVADEARVEAEGLSRLRFGLAGTRPLERAFDLPGSPTLERLRWGAGATGERGWGLLHTRSFHARLDLGGEAEGVFEQELLRSPRGDGVSLDLGLGLDGRWRNAPFQLDLCVDGLFHRQTWRDPEIETRVLRAPATPIDRDFDVDLFTDALVDTVTTRRAADWTPSLAPGLKLGAAWTPGRHEVALLLDWRAESVALGRELLLSLAARRWARNGLSAFGAELSWGEGRGPGLGLEALARICSFQVGLGLKGYAGVSNGSRGLLLGLRVGPA